MSKGSVQRPDDGKYGEGWDRIFGKRKELEGIPLREVLLEGHRSQWDERMKQLDEEQGRPRSIPDYGDLFTLAEFLEMCQHYCFTNDDGSGYYSDGEIYFAGEDAIPSDLVAGNVRKDRTHVMWFNK